MESISPKYYVYYYRYPESMGGMIFYVGKGSCDEKTGYDRIYEHEKQARTGNGVSNTRKIAIIREIWANNEGVIKEKVAFFENEQDAYIYEWGLINMTAYAENLTNVRYWLPKQNEEEESLGEPVPLKVLFGRNLRHIREMR